MHTVTLLKRLFCDARGNVVIVQRPNRWLVLAAAAWAIQHAGPEDWRDFGQGLWYAALVVWTLLELTKGVNWFRRLLGLAVLVTTVWGMVGR